jgi:hypothetical protein
MDCLTRIQFLAGAPGTNLACWRVNITNVKLRLGYVAVIFG